MRAKKTAGRYIAWALAALISIPLSLSGLWVQSSNATNPGTGSTIDYAVTFNTASNATILGADYESLPQPTGTADFTVQMWVKPGSLTASSDSADRMLVNMEKKYAIGSTAGRWQYYVGNGDSWFNGGTRTDTGVSIQEGSWTHIGLVFTTNNTLFYVNGKLAHSRGSRENSGSVAGSDGKYFGLGSWGVGNNTSTQWFDGQVDEIRIWESDRSTSMATDMHTRPTTPAPAVYWDFNEGTGTTVYDRVSPEANLTATTVNYVDVKSTTYPSNGKTVVTFPRTYLPGVGGWTAPAGITLADLLVVGGGGGGGAWVGGGGGGGQVTELFGHEISGGTNYAIKVGSGGIGADLQGNDVSSLRLASDGQASSFGSTLAFGGGRGGFWTSDVTVNAARDIGSSGGSSNTSYPAAVVTSAQGFRGGAVASNLQPHATGGGGGAGGVGANGTQTNSQGGVGGDGGVGRAVWISSPASDGKFAGGGGGGVHASFTDQVMLNYAYTGGSGSSGGGNGAAPSYISPAPNPYPPVIAQSGLSNTGSGGGGAGAPSNAAYSSTGGSGGSGFVAIAYSGKDLAWNKTSTNQNYASRLEGVIPHANAWTVEMWMRPDAATISSDNKYYGIFSQMDNLDSYTQRVSLWLTNGQLHYSNGGGSSGTVTGFKLSETRWHHIAMSSNADTVKVFVDGVEIWSATLARGAYGPLFTIGGARQGGLDVPEFAGHMDQVKVWNGALTAAQLSQSMHTYSTAGITSPPELLAHYDFNEFVTGQVLDRSGNNRHLSFNTEVSGSYDSTDFTDTAIVSDTLVTSVTTNRVFQFNRTYLTADGGWRPPAWSTSVDYLVVAGGGGGGGSTDSNHGGGGGGAGGYLEGSSLSVDRDLTYPVKVGVGGLGGVSGTGGVFGKAGAKGGDSDFGNVNASGGGGGASWSEPATSGGSGGGGAASNNSTNRAGQAGTVGQGFAGGTSPNVSFGYKGSGGGGAGGAGSAASGETSLVNASVKTFASGGPGKSSPITGQSIVRAVGGVGGAGNDNKAPVVPTANSGNGGSGSDLTDTRVRGGSGAAGVVIISAMASPDAPTSLTATSGSIVGLAWTAPTYTGEGSLTDYVIQYRESPSGTWFTFNDGVSTGNSANVTDLEVCKKYDFQVAAKNAIGTSVYSGIASAIVGVGTFSWVEGVTPTLTATRCVLNFTQVGETAWTPPSGTTSADVLAVGGGAGGWADGGGGGGGGSGQFVTGLTLPNSSLTLTVGAGGSRGVHHIGSSGNPTDGDDSTIFNGATKLVEAKGGLIGGPWDTRLAGAKGGSGTGGVYRAGGDGGSGPAQKAQNTAAGSSDSTLGSAGNGQPGLSSPITGSLLSHYGGGGGGGAGGFGSSPSTTDISPSSGGTGGGGGGGGVGPLDGSAPGGLYRCAASPANETRGMSMGAAGVPGSGGGGGAGLAYGDPCDIPDEEDEPDDGERTAGGAGGSGAIVVSFLKPASVALAASGICDGTSTQNGLTVEAGHGEVFYIDTGQGQNIDAAYMAYQVRSTTGRSDLWVEVTGFTGGSVTLANNNDSTLPLGTVASNGSRTAFFMIKASGATTTAQSHVVNVYDTKPTIGDPEPIYSCNYSFTAVEETIKAAANKVNSVTSSSVAQLGATMTITVDGDTGTIGQGNDIDGRMIWLTPAARSNWPTGALRLESTTLTMYSNSQRTSVLSSHTDTLRVNATTSPALSGNNRQYYRAIYTFRVIGPAASSAPIIPVAMISSGTQIKHTDVSGINGGSVDVTSPEVKLTVTKNVSPTTTVNADGTTTFDYTISLVNGGSQTLVIDEVIDTPDTSLVYRSGSAKFNSATIEDPGVVSTNQLGFSGPMSLPANSTRNITYKMVGETCAVGSTYEYTNTATARTGTVVIGSGSATQSVVDIRGNCGEAEAVVEVKDEPIPPTATTSGATSITTSGATISGVVDPNGEPGLGIRFVYSTDPDLSSTTGVNRDASTASSTGYGVSAPLTGLTGGTTYYYRVEIQDKAGNWVLGEIMSFTTLPAPANPTAVTNPVTDISETTARFNGSVDANLVSGGAKVSYEWGVANSDGTCTPPAPTSIQDSGFLQSEGDSGPEDAILTGANPTNMTFEATGLNPGGKYCVRINGHYGASFGTEVSGDWVPFTMAAKSPQEISFSPAIAVLAAWGSTTVNAAADSGLAVTYTSTDTNICTVTSSGVVTAVATSGVCSITATQIGNTSYYAATPKTVSFEISPPVISTLQSEISEGTYQSSYTESLDATGGSGTYSSWTVSRGTLPPGLTLNAATGEITGTPTAAGIYTFDVFTTSNDVASEPKTYTITIAKVVVTITASSTTVRFGDAVPAITASYTGFISPDDETVLNSSPNIAPTCSTNYRVGDNAGSSRISSCSGAWSENYTFTYVNGTVTIQKLALVVRALDSVKQNLDTAGTLTVTADPSFVGKFTVEPALPGGQTLADAIPSGVSISRAQAGTPTGTVGSWPTGETPGNFTITPTGDTSSDNYTITYQTGVFLIQTPKSVPRLSATDAVIDFGETSSSTALRITVSSTCSPTTGTTTFQYFNGSTWATITDVSTLDAGVYTIKARFVPDDTSDCYGRDSEVLETTYQLTVQKATATITASTSQKWVGDPDPTFTWTVSGLTGSTTSADVGRVSLVRTTGEDPGSYNVTPSGASHPNYNFNYIQGKLYIAKILINTNAQGGVLANRNVSLTCAGLKPGASITLTISSDPVQSLATATAANDGTCSVATVIPSELLGNYRLDTESQFPTSAPIENTRLVSLVTDPPAPVVPPTQNPAGNQDGGGGAAPSNLTPTPTASPTPTPSRTPTRGNVPNRPNPGNFAAPRPQPSAAPTPVQPSPGQNVAQGPTRSDPLAEPPLAQAPRLPGLAQRPVLTPADPNNAPAAPVAPAPTTIDTGAGVQEATESQASGAGVVESTRQSGVRTVDQLATERLGGFAPGAGLRIEILGARTGARFVLADLQAIDTVALIRAMEASITTQEADFSKITRVVRGERPLIQEAWSPEVREGIDEFFAAVGLEAPRALIDLDLSSVNNWVSVQAEVETYQPGSTVFLVATSSPIVLATAEVDQNGRAQLAGSMPVEVLGSGEHRVRVVGIRSLEGVSVDDTGEIQLSAELMDEIQRFDLGTQSTIALSGLNPEGGYHSAIRVVPLIPIAPWWTLWFILAGFVLAIGSRYRRLLDTPTRRVIAASGVVASALPAVIIGWVSTVTSVVWVGILLGLVGAVISWFMPEQKTGARRK